jgi:hypothetical protein
MVQVSLFSGDEKFTFDKWFFSGCAVGAVVNVYTCSIQKVSLVKSKQI